MRLITTIFGIVAIATAASAQITKQGNAYLFRMKFAQGQVLKYQVASAIGGMKAGNGQAAKVMIPMVWKVVAVKNKVATIDTTVGPVTVGTQTMMQATKTRVDMDSQGKVVGSAGTGQQVAPTLPTNPIKVGQSWSATAPIALPTGGGSQQQKATYTLKGIKMVSGKQVAELALVTTGQASGKGTILLLVSDGSVFRSTMNLNVQVGTGSGQASKYNVTADIKRV